MIDVGRAATTFADLRRESESRMLVGVTAYDYPTAQLCAAAELDLLLVGDSIGPLLLGIPEEDVSLATMVAHAAAVRRGSGNVPVVVDIPLRNSQRADGAIAAAEQLVGSGGADLVKVEVRPGREETVEALVRSDLPVVAHLDGRWPEWSEEVSIVRTAESCRDLGAAGLVLVHTKPEVNTRVMDDLGGEVLIWRHGPQGACHGILASLPELVGLTPGDVERFLAERTTSGMAGFTSTIYELLRSLRDSSAQGRGEGAQ